MDDTGKSAVETVAQALWVEDMGQNFPWSQVPEGRKAIYRVRAKKQIVTVGKALEAGGWVMLPVKLSVEDATEVAIKTVFKAPAAIPANQDFTLGPAVIQSVLDHIVKQTNRFEDA